MAVPRPPEQRFWSHVDRRPGDCWMWTGATAAETGYGIFRLDSTKLVLAHCFSFELFNPSVVRRGKVVRHTCDTPACVNPEHLVIGTHADNTADMDARGRRRNNPRRGEEHGRAKLTRAAVEEAKRIRDLYGWPVSSIAERFGVSVSAMRAALSGRSWR